MNGLGRTGATNTESSYSCRTYAIILNNAKPMAKPEHQLQCPAPVYTAAVLPAAVCAAAAAANRRVSGFNPRKPVAIIMSCEGVVADPADSTACPTLARRRAEPLTLRRLSAHAHRGSAPAHLPRSTAGSNRGFTYIYIDAGSLRNAHFTV